MYLTCLLILHIIRYGAEQGRGELREAIADAFYPDHITSGDIFVSDGSKCDIGRL